MGGPVVKDRLFFFGGVRTQQPEAACSRASQRSRVHSPGARDLQPAARESGQCAAWTIACLTGNTAFVRYSHDGNNAFAPRETNSLPSAWVSNTNWADSGVFSLISALRAQRGERIPLLDYFLEQPQRYRRPPKTVPDVLAWAARMSSWKARASRSETRPTRRRAALTRRHIFADNMTWQHGTHRFKFGGEWEQLKGTGTYTLDVPAAITLFSPQEVRATGSAAYCLCAHNLHNGQ